MIKYLVAEISGKQYKIEPNKLVWVDFLGDVKQIECDKVLLKAEGDDVVLGNPYLKDKVVFEVQPEIKKQKIRVSTYKPKANTRVVKGGKVIKSAIKLVVKS